MERKLDLSLWGQGGVDWPGYDPRRIRIGIVHLGLGAFHRAHQAAYVEALLGRDPRWGVCGVSLKTTRVRDALRRQDHLYTLTIQSAEPRTRVIGALREALAVPFDAAALKARLAAEGARVVTLTVTEAGYCLGADGALDFTHPDIKADLASAEAPTSAIGWLVEGLRLRRAAGLGALTVLSCDNLSRNGALLKQAVVALAEARDAALARWIDGEAHFPNTMVDAITPKADDALVERVRRTLGAEDAAPVQREAFTQWVIEDHPRDGEPDWASAGVIMADDVAPYALAKLRLVNGAHSALAYAGLLAGFETVYEAMRAPWLSRFVRALMDDAAATLAARAELPSYAEAVRERFLNPAIRHELAQIAMDGSQKLPIRILAPLRERLAKNQDIDAYCTVVAAWLRFLRKRAVAGVAIADPMAARLSALARGFADDAEKDVAAALGLSEVFAGEIAPLLRARLIAAYGALVSAERSGDIAQAFA